MENKNILVSLKIKDIKDRKGYWNMQKYSINNGICYKRKEAQIHPD